MPIHKEKSLLKYTPEQLLQHVSDVESYPEFLPWCLGVRVKEKKEQFIIADMIIGYKVFRENFSSKVQISRPDRIDVTYKDGPFKYLENHWIFIPHKDGGCILDFYVDFEFKSSLLQHAINIVFNKAVEKMVDAFEARANNLFN